MSTYDLDRQEIVDLTIKYCWSIDEHAWDNLREVFLPTATARLGPECDGVDAIIARIQRALDPLDASQHIVANHQVSITGDRATCRCYLHAQHVRHAVDGSPNFIVAGRYEDQLVRTMVGWRIERRELHITWTEGNPKVVGR